MSRFVMPETVKLPLSGEDWIEVKKRLNVGERKHLEAIGVQRPLFSPPTIDWEEYQIGRVAVWLVDWGGPGFMIDGKSKELTIDAIRNLDEETFEEIQQALTKHVEEIEASKKAKPSGTTASPITVG